MTSADVNEIVVAPALLASLPVNEVVVVGKALHAQRALGIKIIDRAFARAAFAAGPL